MESTVIMPEIDVTQKYPCLMMEKDTGCIVMFTSRQTGVTLHVGSDKHTFLGDFGATWFMHKFVPVPSGTIVTISV